MLRRIGLSAYALLSSLTFSNIVLAQSCQTNTVASSPPSDGSAVALQTWSYCGGALDVTSYIQNVDYDKIVQLFYTNADGDATALTVIQLSYQSDVANTNFEIWGANTPNVYLDGISKITNITFQATDTGQTFNQQLNLAITASGSTPTTSSIPAPYATPTGFSDDISTYLAASSGSNAALAKQYMFLNIDVANAANGTVIAAQSYTAPDYAYNWVRDSSLTMDVVQSFYAAANSTSQQYYESILFAYASARAAEQTDPNLQTGLGEPKFNLDNSIFTGPWGRPQNDGPATAAITLMEFGNAYLAAGGSVSTINSQIYDSDNNPGQAPVKKDLLFVASNWTSPSFDAWEEEEADHFYTRLVQHRALSMGAAFATKMGDSATSSTLSSAASDLEGTLSQFWDPVRNLILYEYGPVLHGKDSYKDIIVIIGLIHGYNDDGIYSYTDDQVLQTALQITTSFIPVYPLAGTKTDSSGQTLGIPTGRYPEDVYNGDGTSEGNPWFLATLAMAEFMYRSATAHTAAGSISVTDTSLPFWNYFAPGAGGWSSGQTVNSGSAQFGAAIDALHGWGDAYVRTVKNYGPSGGHLPEEFDRSSGAPTGAADLTWSYAALLTAAFARAEAQGDSNYVASLANMYTPTGSDASS